MSQKQPTCHQQKRNRKSIRQNHNARIETPATQKSRITKARSTGRASHEIKSFSSMSVEDVNKMLGKSVKCEGIKIAEFESVQPAEEMVKCILDRLTELENVISRKKWNEAKSRMIVNAIISPLVKGLNEKYGNKLNFEPEWNIVGNDYRGRADIAVTLDETTVLVVELKKKKKLDLGIAHNLLHILAARQQNIRNGVDMGDTMYGLASNGFESVLLRVVFKENDRFMLTQSKMIKFPTGGPAGLSKCCANAPTPFLARQCGLLIVKQGCCAISLKVLPFFILYVVLVQ
jgi:hypothetical protein